MPLDDSQSQSHITLYTDRNPYSTPGANTSMIGSACACVHTHTHTHAHTHTQHLGMVGGRGEWCFHLLILATSLVISADSLIITTTKKQKI